MACFLNVEESVGMIGVGRGGEKPPSGKTKKKKKDKISTNFFFQS